ncbi:MAG: hypothetical protein IKU37_04755 [Candidatus Gastranaerophilales bacterium]|nr:hypothetical protein [Candidatus Gastranaerophilales bacterium]
MTGSVQMPDWANKYVGSDKAKEIQNKINEEQSDSSYFSDLGVDRQDGLSDEEWLKLVDAETSYATMSNAKVDSSKAELYLDLESWDSSVIDSCYDISALAQELNISDEQQLRTQICELLKSKSNIANLDAIYNQRVYLPTISEIAQMQPAPINPGAPTGGTNEIQTQVQAIYGKFVQNADLDISKEMDKLGILNTEPDPKTFEAGIQSMYYAFGNDWNLVESMMKYSKIMKNDTFEINFAEKLNLALKRCNEGEQGLNKEDIKKAYLIYYGSLSEIPTDAKNSLGISNEEEVRAELGTINLNDTKDANNKFENIINKIDEGNDEPETINAEFLAYEEIYGDDWKDKALEVLQPYADESGNVSNLEYGMLTDTLITDWLEGTSDIEDDEKMYNALEKLYGHKSLWQDARKLDKESVKTLIEFAKLVNDYNAKEIDDGDFEKKLKDLSDDIANLPDQPINTFTAGVKALKEAYGADWIDGFMSQAKVHGEDIGDINFEHLLIQFAESNTENPDKIRSACNIYFGNDGYPSEINNILEKTTGLPGGIDQMDIESNIDKLKEGEKGWSVDHTKFIDVIMGSSPEELKVIVQKYNEDPPGDYKDIKEMIKNETSGQLREILLRTIEIACGERDVNKTAWEAYELADYLWEATGGMTGTNHDAAYKMLIDLPDEKLKEIAEYLYNNDDATKYGGKTLEQIIQDDFEGGSTDDLEALKRKLKRLGLLDEQLSNGNSITSNETLTTEQSENNESTGAFEPASSYLYGGSPQQTDPAEPGQKYYYLNH